MTNWSPNVFYFSLLEIVSTSEKLNGKRIDYETLQRMKYLDQVMCETLRKWPPAPTIDRLCVKEYALTDANNRKIHIEKGQYMWFSVYGIHHDAKYYPEPNKFDPERFSDENKRKIVPGTFIPFGVGPRNCIGKGSNYSYFVYF